MHEAEAIPDGALAPQGSVGVSEAPREVHSARLSHQPRPANRKTGAEPDEGGSSEPGPARSSRRLGLATLGVLAVALAALVPTVGDLGLTWDEPAYRYSQLLSVQWWEQLGRVRSWADVRELLDPTALLYYWPYGRHGINFHPPLAGQLNLATYALFGHWMKDIPARRMASVIEFALTIAIGFHFLARRYGVWAGAVMAGSLLLMPRLYGQAHLIDTDTPGLLLWAATALAFWKGLHEPNARRWRVAVGILLGLAFVEKMAAVMVLLPLLLWLVVRALTRLGNRAAWIDGLLTTVAMLAPLALAFQQILVLKWPLPVPRYESLRQEAPGVLIQILQRHLPPPQYTNLFIHQPVSHWPGAILAIPLLIWFIRRLLGRVFPRNKVWGVERPGLETWTAILAFAPVVGWLGNPAWWRETIAPPGPLLHAEHGPRGHAARYPDHLFRTGLRVQPPVAQCVRLAGHYGPRRDPRGRGDRADLGPSEDPSRPAPILFPHPPTRPADRPDVPDAGPRRRTAVPADLLLPVGVRGLGDGLAGGGLDPGRPRSVPVRPTGAW